DPLSSGGFAMSHASHCCFCQRLPVARRRMTGRPSKCPVCFGELIVAGGTGETYRVAGPEDRQPQRWGGRYLVVASLAVVALLTGLTVAALLRKPTDGTVQNMAAAPLVPSNPVQSMPAAAKEAVPNVTVAAPAVVEIASEDMPAKAEITSSSIK